MTIPARPADEVPKIKYARGHHPNSLTAGLNNIAPHNYLPGENGHGRVYPLKERLQHLMFKSFSQLTEADKKTLEVGEVLALSTMEGAILRESKPLDIVWDRMAPVVNKNLLLGDITIRIVDDDDDDSRDEGADSPPAQP